MWLSEVSPTSIGPLLATAVALLAVAAAASHVPARRATLVHPRAALNDVD